LTQGGVSFVPELKLLLNGLGDLIQLGEILIVQTLSPRQLPNSFNGIEFRTVGWQKVELEISPVQFPPSLMEPSMVIGSVIDNEHHAPTRAASRASQMLEKSEIGFLVEFPFLSLINQLTIMQSNGSEVTHTLASGMMPEDRIDDFRNPHPAPRPKLLEMNFVPPKVHSRIAPQHFQFFCAASAKLKSAWTMAGRGCETEISCRNNRWHCRIPNWTRTASG
jgi:hypothetical protein